MTTYSFMASQVVPADLVRTWAFFSDPMNLSRITPSSMAFVVRSTPEGMHDGQTIDYTVRPLAGIPVAWRTRIDHVDAPHSFTDVQVHGPYGRWVHTHTFVPVEGGTRIDDVVEYEMPLGIIGRVAHAIAVRPRLEEI